MVCTICGAKDKHVAASCPLRPRPINMQRAHPIDTLISLILVAVFLYGYVHGWVKQALA